jgi:hypothetical protein
MVELSVCGDIRRYQCIASERALHWLDVTHSTEPHLSARTGP